MSKDRKKSGMLERNRRMADLRKRQRRRSGHSTSISPAATGIAAVLVAGGLGLGAAQLAAHVDGAANRQATEAEAEAEQTAESAEETAAKMAAAAAETKKAEETTEENPADKALESAAAASEKSDKSGTKSNAGSTTGSSGSQGGSSSGSTGSTGSGSSTGTGSSTGSGSSTGAGSSTGSGSSTGAGSGTGTAGGAAGSAAGSQSGAQGVTGLSSSDVAAQVEAARAAAAGQTQTAEQQAQAAAAAQAQAAAGQGQAAAAAQARTAQNTQAELRAQYKGGSVVSQDTVNSVGKQAFFSAQPIDDEVFARIQGKSYANGCTVSLDRLRYVRILYHGFDGQTHVGEVICNSTLAQDLLEIFGGLYDAGYPIESVRLIDEFGANDETSSVANNSSSFNFRFIDGTTDLSLHGTGLAIDINPLYNPTVFTDGSGCYPAAGAAYADRTKSFAHKIDQNDLCYQLFVQHGWTWGGSWKEDPAYMHFSKTWPPET